MNPIPSFGRWHLARLLTSLGFAVLLTSRSVHAAGTVTAWGDNTYGQTNVPMGLSNVVAVAGGSMHSLALLADGTVTVCVGTYVPAGLSNVVAVAAGYYYNLVLLADGTVTAWGNNTYGQTNVPSVLNNVVAVAARDSHNLVLRADGSVAAWGDNAYGKSDVPSGLSNVVAVAAGGDHSLALRADGTVAAWGDNFHGQTNVPAGLSNVVAVAAGGYHSLALRADGTVAAWGPGSPGASGFYDHGQASVPTGLNNVVAVAAGGYHSLALRADGSVAAWGAGSPGTSGFYDHGQASVPAGLNSVLAIAGGESYSLALVETTLRIVTQPTSLTNIAGTTAMFSVLANGLAPLAYQWHKASVSLTDGGNIIGATSNTLVLSNLLKSDEGDYSVVVSNISGTVTSVTVVLKVWGIAPAIVIQPIATTNVAGMQATFTVGATGSPPLGYQWFNGGTNLADGGRISGATSTNLTISNLQPSDTGNYFVVVTNAWGVVTSSVVPLVVTIGPAPCYRYELFPLTLDSWWAYDNGQTCRVSQVVDTCGEISARIQNTRNSGFLNVCSLPPQEFAPFPLVAWCGWSNPDFIMFSYEQGGIPEVPVPMLLGLQWTAYWSAGIGIGGSTDVVRVAARRTVTATNLTVIIGTNSYFGCTELNVDLSYSAAVLAWAQTNQAFYFYPGVGCIKSVWRSQDGSVRTVQAIAWDIKPAPVAIPLPDLGTAIEAANLIWTSGGSLPWYVQTCESHSAPYAARSGLIKSSTESWIETSVPGPAQLSFWWKVSSQSYHFLSIYVNGVRQARISGEVDWTQSSLSLPVGSNVVRWVYSKNQSSAEGQDAAWLDGVIAMLPAGPTNTPPTITVQPTDRVAQAGNTVSFQVGASGSSPLNYQWRWNGTNLVDGGNLSGVTATILTNANVQFSDAGNYTVVVTNAYGSVTSSVAGLTVQSPQTSPWVWAKHIASTVNPDGERTLGLAMDSQTNVFTAGWFDGANDFGGVTLTNRGGQGQDIFLATYNSSGALQGVRRAGGSSAERDAGLGIGLDAGGNVYVTGGFYDTADFGNLSVTAPPGQESFFLAKYNPTGTAQWVRQADSPSANECKGEGLAVDVNGNSYAVGTFDGTTLALGSTTLTNQGEFNTFLVKFDSSGAPQWAKNFSSTNRAFAGSIAVDTNGFAYVAGHFVSTMSIDGTNFTAANTNGWNGFVAKFSGAGVLQWATTVTGTNGVVMAGICPDNLGHVYVSGGFGTVTGATATFGPSIALTSFGGGSSGTSRSHGMGDAFLAKYDAATGVAQWAHRAGATGMDVFSGVSTGPQGNVYVTGAFENGGNVAGLTVPVSNGWHAVVAKYDANGAAEWVEYAGATGMTLPMRLVVDSAGDGYVTGWYQGTATFGTNVLPSSGLYNQFLAKLVPPTQFPLRFCCLSVFNGSCQMRLDGLPGASVIMDSSFNLTTWTPWQTNTLPAGGLPLAMPMGTNRQFLRARIPQP